jgi:hypothetical protein
LFETKKQRFGVFLLWGKIIENRNFFAGVNGPLVLPGSKLHGHKLLRLDT